MKKSLFFLVAALLSIQLSAQSIEWNDITADYEFPEGLRLFHGTISGNTSFFAYYYEVDMSNPDIAIRPYLKASAAQVHVFSEEVGAYGAINGGFFAGSSSVSSIIYPNEVAARNLIAVTRSGKTYPVIRSIFALNRDRSMATEWVYHHSYAFEDIYIYDEPMPYLCDDPNPLPVPLKADGHPYEEIAYGIGGGPMLIKDGALNITYCEEIFWGSGVYMTDFRPRTAVGYTYDHKAILFVTNHMKIGDMAEVLFELGCVEAMNLDGGGSTAMAAGGQSIYNQNRPVPSILAIVHSDSLDIPKVPLFEKTMDTSDEGVTSVGSWFATANEGYWGSPSMLHGLATHDEYYEFPLNLPAAAEYEVYAWWTSHSNRAADTPFFITHADGVTEVNVNQSIGGSMWNLIGTFNFNGSGGENIRITAGATTNQFVVADGIRIVSYDQQFFANVITHIEDVEDITVPWGTPKDDALAMLSQQTVIRDAQDQSYTVDLFWESEDYQAETAGSYDAVGTFELPEQVEQTDPPTPLEVHAVITVDEADDDTGTVHMGHVYPVVFPNPATDRLNVEGTLGQPHTLRMLGIDGTLIYQGELNGSFIITINLENLAPGLYLLHINGDELNKTEKVIVQ
ncbi:MAG: phosphodiester glycosidase family protein [Bacteroidales bacterium]|nr:phosphodiester glycosidase family protein [Bacteroidales bacterium]